MDAMLTHRLIFGYPLDVLLPSLALGLTLLALILGLAALFRKDHYRARPLFTENEREFHRRLLSALPSYEVAPEVSKWPKALTHKGGGGISLRRIKLGDVPGKFYVS
ncbi:hypothetical protein [Microvirga lotononidis]|uniref:Uncharacterized protein n=1 Tax=Microvirga lotononidis TaxID=864069 RepID=I4YXA8_9HYPH|nr:hypothetical protein [Microvirga lotononidis]EIM28600.1 hypothetical protein MicloDRAFT_00027380 [Microvirga lotononidis]WQO30395.1 hypothetical protein U0023_29500 [Microvirga lotononidis]